MSEKLQRAEMLYDAGLYVQADGMAREVLGEEPENADAFCLLSIIDIECKRRLQSIEAARQAVRIAPNYYYAQLCLANALYVNYQFDEALKQIKIALSLEPQNVGSYTVAGKISIVRGDAEACLQYAEQGLAIDALSSGCLHQKSLALRGLGRLAESEEIDKARLAAHPGDAHSHLSRGYGAGQSQDLDLMLEHFTNALRIAPDSIYAHYAIAIAYIRKKDFVRAEAHAAIAYEKDKQDIDSALLLSDILGKRHRFADSLTILLKANNDYPETGRIIVRLAEEAMLAGDNKLATRTARQMLKLKSNVYYALCVLLRCSKNAQEVEAYSSQLEAFLSTNPNTEEFYYLTIMRALCDKQYDVIVQAARTGLELYADDQYLREQLVLALVALKKYDQAYLEAEGMDGEKDPAEKMRVLVAIDLAQRHYNSAIERIQRAMADTADSEPYVQMLKGVVHLKWFKLGWLQSYVRKALVGDLGRIHKNYKNTFTMACGWLWAIPCLLWSASAGALYGLLSTLSLLLDGAGRRYFSKSDRKIMLISLAVLLVEAILISQYRLLFAMVSSIKWMSVAYFAFLAMLVAFWLRLTYIKRFRALRGCLMVLIFVLLLRELLVFFNRHPTF